MRRVKHFFLIGLVAALVTGLIGGCVKMDYHFFKQKYPDSSVGGYVWHKLTSK